MSLSRVPHLVTSARSGLPTLQHVQRVFESTTSERVPPQETQSSTISQKTQQKDIIKPSLQAFRARLSLEKIPADRLLTALTHKSAKPLPHQNNDRDAILGSQILNTFVTEHII